MKFISAVFLFCLPSLLFADSIRSRQYDIEYNHRRGIRLAVSGGVFAALGITGIAVGSKWINETGTASYAVRGTGETGDQKGAIGGVFVGLGIPAVLSAVAMTTVGSVKIVRYGPKRIRRELSLMIQPNGLRLAGTF